MCFRRSAPVRQRINEVGIGILQLQNFRPDITERKAEITKQTLDVLLCE